MASGSGRPVYVPSRKRTTKRRFHGAFTGGFSAGYFNTVGSAEGWAPQNGTDTGVQTEATESFQNDNGPNDAHKLVKKQQQRMEDFMDDQDHNEWGGPTQVRGEYDAHQQPSSTSGKMGVSGGHNPLVNLVSPPLDNVGHRLLRVLGWRDGSKTAYVRATDEDNEHANGTQYQNSRDTADALQHSSRALSSRRLKKIQLQQNRVPIPAPKHDTCGLGYEAYHDAPEFRRDRERRRRLAEERAKAVTNNDAANRNVYRVSNVLGDEHGDDEEASSSARPRGHGEINNDDDTDGVLTSYETVQDFVGTKTVGGFALREDDDDVYDNQHHAAHKRAQVNLDEYDTELHEHADSDVDEDDNEAGRPSGTRGSYQVGSVLASWASLGDGKASDSVSVSRGSTSDGRPPLPGFVLGGTTMSSNGRGQKRFPGPDIPLNYNLDRHRFGPDENPGGLKRESVDRQFEEMENRRRLAASERKANAQRQEKEKSARNKPMASPAFAGLAAAMRNRFTASQAEGPEDGSTRAVGMQKPSSVSSSATAADDGTHPAGEKKSPKKEISIARRVMTFAPESLLCKRFHVTAPSNVQPSTNARQSLRASSEASFFEREVLASAKGSMPTTSKDEEGRSFPDWKENGGFEKAETDDAKERPPMELLASIFGPESASDASEAEQDDQQEPPFEERSDRKASQQTSAPPSLPTSAGSEKDNSLQLDGPYATFEPEKSDESKRSDEDKGGTKRRRERSHSPNEKQSSTDEGHRQRRDRRKTSDADSESSSTDEDRRRKRRERRKREEKKKRRKKHKSRRRKSDED